MLRDGLGKVLFIGPAFVTKWMGYSVAISKVTLDAMHRNGFRIAREDDMAHLSDYDRKRIGDGKMKYREDAASVVAAPASPVVVPIVEPVPEPIAVPVVAQAIEPLAEDDGKYPAKKRRKRIVKTKSVTHAD